MIEVQQLCKVFGQHTAVDDLSFQVGKGEVLGFLGPNGAGKTTTMRMITGFLPPTSGKALIGGSDILRDSLTARKRLGYLPENAPAYADMTVGAFLTFIAGIRGFSGADLNKRVNQTLERCFLENVRFQNIGTLSKGFKQRVCFAQSILHDPEYLIMDEPTDGLDPNQKREVRQMIQEMAQNKTIILSTHILEEVEAVCTRAVIIAHGRIVADDTPRGLKSRSRSHGAIRVLARKRNGEGIALDMGSLPGVDRVEILREKDGLMEFRLWPVQGEPAPAEKMVKDLVEKGYGVESFEVEQGRLDEVFQMVTQKPLSEPALEKDA